MLVARLIDPFLGNSDVPSHTAPHPMGLRLERGDNRQLHPVADFANILRDEANFRYEVFCLSNAPRRRLRRLD